MDRLVKISFLLLLVLSHRGYCYSFQQTEVSGFVTDSSGKPIEKASIRIRFTTFGTYSGTDGRFLINIPPDLKEITLDITCVGYRSTSKVIFADGKDTSVKILLQPEITEIGEVKVSGERKTDGATMLRLPVNTFSQLPTASGGFEGLLKTLPGVNSNNELSSQYSVRGGSFDENLVYINDIEVFTPFLIRSGQQEGLSFINPDLISSVSFSSGGFNSSYGDKMSSVLDVKYRKPVRTAGSVSLGLLLSSAYFEGLSKNGRLSWLAGVRYKSTKLMLKTLDSKGDYQPVFADIQSQVNYKTGKRSDLSFLLAYASNTYNYVPQSRTSNFGTEALAYQLYVLFEGREKDRYSTLNSVLTWETSDDNGLKHKFMISSFSTNEKESFDIMGYYSLSSLDKNAGSENFSDSIMNIGIGNFHNHARNRLSATIFSAGYKGEKNYGKVRIIWGLHSRHDRFEDRIREWTKVDSAGYSIPYSTSELNVSSLIAASNLTEKLQFDGYTEVSGNIYTGAGTLSLNAGARGLYSGFTNEFLVSPRFSADLKTEGSLTFRMAAGMYVQPPFYRDMRFRDGTINYNIISQRSFHTVFGITYDFVAWGRPFVFSGDIYNKVLRNIIPYRIDNVRLIYDGENSAEGYSRGIDIRLNGEFVPDAESWISISVMDSELKIPGVLEGSFPAPYDQTFSTNIFFQDYLPGYPAWRAHINIAYATGIPVVSPFNDRYDLYRRLPAYRRVDLGITRIIKGKYSKIKTGSFLNHFTEIKAGLEIFNLLDINNTVSYFWVKTINNLSGVSRHFAVPNYLTGRSLNIKIAASF
jgi:hypothetical protein